ncbi:MAG: CpsB/CapC family capsule biosynthesis tyrosine phosphatase, partial [Terriglobales bacterium]
MPPFVDTHLHLLPGLDDGPATMEAALEAAEVAIADGVVAVVATPHSNYQWPFQPDRVNQLRTEMQTLVGERMRITTGCELHLSYENVQAALANPRAFTLNASRYLLVEFPELFDREAFAGVLDQLVGIGMVP